MAKLTHKGALAENGDCGVNVLGGAVKATRRTINHVENEQKVLEKEIARGGNKPQGTTSRMTHANRPRFNGSRL